MNLNDSVNLFYDILYAAIDCSVQKIGMFPRKFPGWFSPELKLCIKNGRLPKISQTSFFSKKLVLAALN